MCWAAGAILARLSLLHLRSSTGTVISLIAGVAVVMSLVLVFFRDYVGDLSGTIFLWFALAGVLQSLLGRFLNYSSRAADWGQPRSAHYRRGAPVRHPLCRTLHRRAADPAAPCRDHRHHRGRGPDCELAVSGAVQKTA